MDTLSCNTFGFLPCDLQQLCDYLICQLEEKEFEEIDKSIFTKPRNFVKCSAMPKYSIEPIPSVRWDEIGGLDSVKVQPIFSNFTQITL